MEDMQVTFSPEQALGEPNLDCRGEPAPNGSVNECKKDYAINKEKRDYKSPCDKIGH